MFLSQKKNLRDELKETEFKYECGSFQTSCDADGKTKTVYFVRVTDIKEVVMKTLTELCSSRNLYCPPNIPPSELRLLVTGDKSGSSTKLYLQTLNVKSITHKNWQTY